MSKNKELIDLVNSINADKYVEADNLLPKVVEATLKNLINKKKDDVLKQLNFNAEKIAISALENDTK